MDDFIQKIQKFYAQYLPPQWSAVYSDQRTPGETVELNDDTYNKFRELLKAKGIYNIIIKTVQEEDHMLNATLSGVQDSKLGREDEWLDILVHRLEEPLKRKVANVIQPKESTAAFDEAIQESTAAFGKAIQGSTR
ncbi:hypothetical protein WOLCODRAFT_141350 [Wolfiporia cocos MD-104 SS10]|uniref:Uncharacterized protein n=1 Tax=Wolfiporia cocos (strain MD-104) TaxID=742152 RepID=A0A2H3JCP7_WOLCO|nr:hypothetical protein WOLCODRAFT_141350 [Wolfiporia cocos MD-104 SS10]